MADPVFVKEQKSQSRSATFMDLMQRIFQVMPSPIGAGYQMGLRMVPGGSTSPGAQQYYEQRPPNMVGPNMRSFQDMVTPRPAEDPARAQQRKLDRSQP